MREQPYITQEKFGKPPLPRWQQDALVRKAKTGDKEARAELVERNMGFIITVVMRYRPQWVDSDELLNVGVEAYLHALDLFDTDRGTTLNTYAEAWIVNNMQAFRGQRRYGIPHTRNEVAVRSQIIRADAECWIAFGRQGTPEEIAERMSVTKSHSYESRLAQVKQHYHSYLMPSSLDEPMFYPSDEGDVLTKYDVIAVPGTDPLDILIEQEDRFEGQASASARLASLFERLTPQQVEIVKRRYGIAPFDTAPEAPGDGKKRGDSNDGSLLDATVIAEAMGIPTVTVTTTLANVMKGAAKKIKEAERCR